MPIGVFACDLPQQRTRRKLIRFLQQSSSQIRADRSFLPLARQVLCIAVGMGNFAAALPESPMSWEHFKMYMRKLWEAL
jgi:hypothetical protein